MYQALFQIKTENGMNEEVYPCARFSKIDSEQGKVISLFNSVVDHKPFRQIVVSAEHVHNAVISNFQTGLTHFVYQADAPKPEPQDKDKQEVTPE